MNRINHQEKKLYRQSVVLTKDMKKVLDEYCSSIDIPKSNFIRKVVFKEIANSNEYWKNRITW